MGKSQMRAVIVAGGRGTRMGHLTQAVPKPMLHIAGKPILEHQINFLKNNGITDIFILIGYIGNIIRNYFGDGDTLGVNIKYFQEEAPLGTSGSIKTLEDKMQDDFLVVYGDLMLDMKLDDFFVFHKAQNGVGTIVIHPNDHPYDSDLVVMDEDHRIIDFLPKNRKTQYYSNLVSAAVYILSPAVFKYIPESIPSDFVRDVFPEMLKNSEKLYGYKTAEYIKDMGTVDRFENANRDFLSGKIHRLSRNCKRPAVFIDRDGTLVEEIHLLHKAESLRLYPFSTSAIKKVNDSGLLSFLITNQPVVARNLCGIEEVKTIHNKLETLLGYEHAYLNDIYFCPHHPDKGYTEENSEYKVDCNCRKPKIGMIETAIKEYNVDIKSSWFIGDTTTDIQTGINAGMQTILVLTGKGGKDKKFHCSPDFVFDNLKTAVDFILENRIKYNLYLDEIINVLKKYQINTPVVISIAGLARSGKSTFLRLLVQALQKNGISSQFLSLDNWLVGVNERRDNMTVRERYKYHEIRRDFTKLMNHGKILLKIYDPYSRNIVNEKYFSLDGSRCLIIDGVPSLDIDVLRDISHIKVYIDVDENVRKNRFFSFYRWKDLSDEDINNLYIKRLKDEVPFIKESKNYATIIVKI